MARPFEFSSQTINSAWVRQNGRCAICGQKLYRTGNPYQAHHMVSARFGGKDDLQNCAIVCTDAGDGIPGGCHLFAHGDSYNRLFELDRSEYRYLYG